MQLDVSGFSLTEAESSKSNEPSNSSRRNCSFASWGQKLEKAELKEKLIAFSFKDLSIEIHFLV